jgi:secreted trypsin-like serine protease
MKTLKKSPDQHQSPAAGSQRCHNGRSTQMGGGRGSSSRRPLLATMPLATMLAALLLMPSLAPSAGAQVMAETGNSDSRIVNGDLTSAWPTTGALLHNPSGAIDPDSASAWCSGTMIGCRTFLTAAHCVEDSLRANRYLVFLQHGGFFTVDSITMHPSYSSGSWPEADVAVVHLSDPVEGIRPTPINTTDPTSFIPHEGTIVGFGRSGATDGGDDYGLKRVGLVDTQSCVPENGVGNNELICWAFPGGTRGEESNTCNGDSGGPLFMNLGSGLTVAGITSGGSSDECGPGDSSFDANVATYASYINSEGGADLGNTSCGAGAQVEDSQVTVHAYSGRLTSSNSSDTFSFNAPSSASKVVVTMNGSESNSPNFNLYVSAGSTPTTSNADCTADGSGQWASCIFNAPASGAWNILVDRIRGNADYQVTATVFSDDPPVCGDNNRGGAEECDGSDDSACPGLCDNSCSCPAPVCGNDTVESGEECDGSDAAACTGLCTNGCACPAPFCGNDTLEDGEQCDGSDDSACSGECDSSCSCPAPPECGNNTTEAGEECDGNDDGACESGCDLQTCMCSMPGQCSTDDLLVFPITATTKNLKVKAELDNFAGDYDGMRPDNDGLALTLNDGFNQVAAAVPGGTGWERSKPAKGKYLWKGDHNGLRRIVMRDRSATTGYWKILVKGRYVDGSGDLDLFEFIDVNLTTGGTCFGGFW